jgi:hypothetical protein
LWPGLLVSPTIDIDGTGSSDAASGCACTASGNGHVLALPPNLQHVCQPLS